MLWSTAVKLANEYGINRTAQALRLDYNCLKKRMEAQVSDVPTQDGAKFIQLLGSELTAVSECAIECRNTNGATIRIRAIHHDILDFCERVLVTFGGGAA